MTIHYFEKVKKRIAKLEWLIDREGIEIEYDEDADVGIIGGNITFIGLQVMAGYGGFAFLGMLEGMVGGGVL